MDILIKNAKVLKGAGYKFQKADIVVDKGKVKEIAPDIKGDKFKKTIDAKGCVAVPGLFDIHVHLRQPGREDAETMATGTRAAVRGGICALSCMPNTKPPIDNGGMVEFLLSQVKANGMCNVHPFGAITKGLAGEELAEIGEMRDSGCVGITDDGYPVSNPTVLRRALSYASYFDILVMQHCEDKQLAGTGVMNEGFYSTKLGLRGIPSASESIMVARDAYLAKLAKTRIHVAHISTKDSVEAIRRAKAEGIDISAHTCPHYFCLTDEKCKSYNTNFKINPPLRAQEDVDAVIEGIKDGTLEVIASDHAPHPAYEKEKDFNSAPFGSIGLETLFSVSYTYLVDKGHISLEQLIKLLSYNPAKLLNLDYGVLDEGKRANITVIDLEREWTVKAEDTVSKSKNSAFLGETLKGCINHTIVNGTLHSFS